MSTETNDEGPDFPMWEITGFGMTLRDYFAAKMEGLAEDVTLEYAEALAGRKRPNMVPGSPENTLEWGRFWADADAALRYIKADAMLAAREATKRKGDVK